MADITYFVALPFTRSEEEAGIVAGEPKEARTGEQAVRLAGAMANAEGQCRAIAFSRRGDPALGEFEDAVVLRAFGEVDAGLLTA